MKCCNRCEDAEDVITMCIAIEYIYIYIRTVKIRKTSNGECDAVTIALGNLRLKAFRTEIILREYFVVAILHLKIDFHLKCNGNKWAFFFFFQHTQGYQLTPSGS